MLLPIHADTVPHDDNRRQLLCFETTIASLNSHLRCVGIPFWALSPGERPFAQTIRWPVKGNHPTPFLATLLRQRLQHVSPAKTHYCVQDAQYFGVFVTYQLIGQPANRCYCLSLTGCKQKHTITHIEVNGVRQHQTVHLLPPSLPAEGRSVEPMHEQHSRFVCTSSACFLVMQTDAIHCDEFAVSIC